MVEETISFLQEVFSESKVSSVYRTPSINGDGSMYANAVFSGLSSMSDDEAESLCKSYEKAKGRSRIKGDAVVIDLDVVMVDDTVLRPKDYSRGYFTKGFRELS